MWFGTETGLSRFDGTHFKNFYSSDGLPDNEIIKLFVDSKNRVWIAPFRNAIAYYYKGEIHNQQNDSLLKKINLASEVNTVVEDPDGNILIQETHASHIIQQGKTVITIKDFNGLPINVIRAGLNKANKFRIALSNPTDTGFKTFVRIAFADIVNNKLVIQKNHIVLDRPFTQKKVKWSIFKNHYGTIYIGAGLEIILENDKLNFAFPEDYSQIDIPFPKQFINLSVLNDSIVSLNTLNGSMFFNCRQKKIISSFLRGFSINGVIEDTEGSLWFSTFGKGIYRLGSLGVANYPLKLNDINLPVYTIQKSDSLLLIGTDNCFLWWLNTKRGTLRGKQIEEGANQGRVTAILPLKNGHMLIGGDNGLLLLDRNVFDKLPIFDKTILSVVNIKSLSLSNNNELLVAGSAMILRMRTKDFTIIDTIWYGRTTAIYNKGDTMYIGTLNGLYAKDQKKNIFFFGNSSKLLSIRITAIVPYNKDTLCVATSGNGLVLLKDDKIIADITEHNGLTSNICRNISILKNDIWVGTDKGINKISVRDTGFHIINYTYADGLNSDIINAMYVDSNKVWLGLPDGLTTFDEKEISKKSNCLLHITDITVSEKKWLFDTTDFTLTHDSNNIKFNFVGISYKSGGEIIYRYKLDGLDTAWKTTHETFLSYPSLPSGKYKLELYAINKFGVESNRMEIKFTVEKLIWERLWFQAIVLLVLLAAVWAIAYMRIKNLKRREQQKTFFATKIAELEQMALRSQMNPHFIFNSLNSIQQYVIDKDIVGANEFITTFSRLIRMTLDISSRLNISLQEEIKYISTYLELEKRRFENKFEYEIRVAGEINTEHYFIPPMILQPYIENSIRHGMRYKSGSDGKILIRLEQDTKYLICSVEDNGIGRKLAGQFKSNFSIEYQSKGMTLTAKRIEVFNKTHNHPILVDIKDLYDESQSPSGTKIIVFFPLQEVLHDK